MRHPLKLWTSNRKDVDFAIDVSAASFGGGLLFAKTLLEALETTLDPDRTVAICSQENEQALGGYFNTVTAPSRFAGRAAGQQLIGAFFPNAHILATGNFGPLANLRRTTVISQNALYFQPKDGEPTWVRGLSRWLARTSVSHAAHNIVLSNSMAADIQNCLGIPASQISVIPPPVAALPDAVRPTADTKTDFRYLLAVANHMPHKRLGDLVSAWNDIGDDELHVVIIGKSYWPEISDRLTSNAGSNSERLHLVGAVESRAELAWWYENAEVVVSSSNCESFGLTPLEAASVGARLVLSDIAAHVESCGDRATYFATGNVTDLAEAIRTATKLPKPSPFLEERSVEGFGLTLTRALDTFRPR